MFSQKTTARLIMTTKSLLLHLILLHCLHLFKAADENSKYPLYVLVTGPYPSTLNTGWDAGISLIPAVRLAFDEINSKGILQNYSLQMIEEDSGCRVSDSKPTQVFNSFIEGYYYNQFRNRKSNSFDKGNRLRGYSDKSVVAIIGPGCSDPAIVIAPLLASPEVNIVQIAPTATSPLIESLNYNTTFTMISSSLSYINSIIELIRWNQWKNVALLYDALGGNFLTTKTRFTKQIGNLSHLGYNISYLGPIYDMKGENLRLPLNDLRLNTTLRIVVVFGGASTVRKVLCLAFHLNMTYPNYQWIFSERSLRNFEISNTLEFIFEGINYRCSPSQMRAATNGSILNNYILKASDSSVFSGSGSNFSTYTRDYKQYFDEHYKEPAIVNLRAMFDESFEPTIPPTWQNAYYDAGWALGLAFQQLISQGHNLRNISTGQSNFTQLLSSELLRVNFTGATGGVNFNEKTRSVQTAIMISQVWYNNNSTEGNETEVSTYSRSSLTSPPAGCFIENYTFQFVKIPVQIHAILATTVILVTVMLTLIIALLQISFIVCYKAKSIKAVSPNISFMIFSGCYLFSLATIVHSIQESFLKLDSHFEVVYPVLCSVVMWCLMLGSSLIFGTIFVKIWRVFRLFKHFRNKSPGVLLSDNALICGVIVFIIFDLVICIAWLVISPWFVVQEKTLLRDSQQLLIRSSCSCESIEIWIAGVASYKGFIALLLVIISVRNRKIQKKNFSYTKNINILVYSLTILGSIGFPLYMLLKDINIYISYFNIVGFFLLAMFLCFYLLFLPPVLPVIKKKFGINENVKMSHHLVRKFSTMSVLRDSDGDESYSN